MGQSNPAMKREGFDYASFILELWFSVFSIVAFA